MRLVVVSPPGEGQLGVSLARGFAEEGHDVAIVAASALTAGQRVLIVARRHGMERPLAATLVTRLIRVAQRKAPDAVLVIKGRFLGRADVTRLRRRLGAPVINYYPDDPLYPEFREDQVVDALAAYDLVFTWAEPLAAQLRSAGVSNVAVVPFGYDPTIYSPRPPDHVYDHDVAFAGQWYPVRQRFLSGLAGMNLVITGTGWLEATRGTPLEQSVLKERRFGNDAAQLYWSSRIGVNILHPVNLAGHNMRTWELPATRTATIATRTRDHERLFDGGGAVLIEEPGELRPAVEELLSDDTRRQAVADAGYEAVAGGTYRQRAREIVRHVEALPRHRP